MKCPFCNSTLSSVIDKRSVLTSGEIRRRRECLKCKRRFTTYERASVTEIFVLKREGKREIFSRDKLERGLQRALEKRPASNNLSEIVDKIENKLRVRGQTEIASSLIGKVALGELKKIDKVAYLRFASVYRQFKDPGDFSKIIESLN